MTPETETDARTLVVNDGRIGWVYADGSHRCVTEADAEEINRALAAAAPILRQTSALDSTVEYLAAFDNEHGCRLIERNKTTGVEKVIGLMACGEPHKYAPMAARAMNAMFAVSARPPMTDIDDDDCPLCKGCEEVLIAPQGDQRASDNYGCPLCMSRDFAEERARLQSKIDRLRTNAMAEAIGVVEEEMQKWNPDSFEPDDRGATAALNNVLAALKESGR